MFSYSERPGTLAGRQYQDDIPAEVKQRRLTEIIDMQKKLSHESNKKDLNKVFRVLTENYSKKSPDHLCGRSSQNKVVIFPKMNYQTGQYVDVLVNDCTAATLLGVAIENPN